MKYDEADGYIELVNAIMAQAAEDYRGALKVYKIAVQQLAEFEKMAELPHAPAVIHDRIKDAENRRNGALIDAALLEKFFYGRWAKALTGGANMGYIVKELRKEQGLNEIPRH